MIPRGSCVQCGSPLVTRDQTKFCSRDCRSTATTKPLPTCVQCGGPVKHRSARLCSYKCAGSWRSSNFRGPRNHNWKGGTKAERQRLMEQKEYKQWRTEVFERDNYTCQH